MNKPSSLAAFALVCALAPSACGPAGKSPVENTEENAATAPVFKHQFIEQKLEGDAWGQTSFSDVDRDGDLDFVTGQRGGPIRWYEFRKGEPWRKHLIGDPSPSDVGGTMLDVDGDQWPDMVAGGAWYRNPHSTGENPTGEDWSKHVFDENLRKVHDIIAADIDGDGRSDIVTMAGEMEGITKSDSQDLRWYKIPADPALPWTFQRIADSVHSGIAAADLDRDGDTDLLRSNVWLENLESGKRWIEHRFLGLEWDYATQGKIADINGDQRLDIILTEGEINGGRIAWFEAPEDPKTTPWPVHFIVESAEAKRGPFHSLQVADFDGDQDIDIFAGEMELYGSPPHQWFLWENTLGAASEFREHVIVDLALGTHEAVIGDVDGDGDIDIAGKLWRPDPENGNGGSNHADFIENLGWR